MTLEVLTLSTVVRWLACIVTNVELRLLLDFFKFVLSQLLSFNGVR